jgi:hypothetical protein
MIHFTVKLNPDEWDMVRFAARQLGKNPADWAKELLLKAAREMEGRERVTP